MDRAAAERGAHEGPGEWGASPAAAVSMPGSGVQAGGAPAAYLPPAAVAAGATPMAPPAAYPAPVYGAPPPPPPAPPGAGLPVGLPAGRPVPAHNPYAPPPRGGARPTYGPPSGTAQPTYGPPSAYAQPAFGAPGPGAMPPSAGAPSSSVPRADPGARYLDAATPPAVPHSYAEQYGYGYDTDAPPWAGGAAARPVGSGMSIAAFVLAAIALFVLPPFFGAAAIVMAAFAIRRGERLGRASLITSILCLAGGVTLGVLTYTASIPGF